jgi:hypothetical protein
MVIVVVVVVIFVVIVVVVAWLWFCGYCGVVCGVLALAAGVLRAGGFGLLVY